MKLLVTKLWESKGVEYSPNLSISPTEGDNVMVLRFSEVVVEVEAVDPLFDASSFELFL